MRTAFTRRMRNIRLSFRFGGKFPFHRPLQPDFLDKICTDFSKTTGAGTRPQYSLPAFVHFTHILIRATYPSFIFLVYEYVSRPYLQRACDYRGDGFTIRFVGLTAYIHHKKDIIRIVSETKNEKILNFSPCPLDNILGK